MKKPTCQSCGKKIATSKSNYCDECKKDRASLFYAHNGLRFDIWEYLRHNGQKKTREFYNLIVAEEGEKWTRTALGDKLLTAILGDY